MANEISLIKPGETTGQLTTFDLEKRSKTLHVAPGETTVIGEVNGSGYIAQLWMTFPGWFWQHWNQTHPISPTILKTLLVSIYFDGAESPAVHAPAADLFGCGLCEVGNFACDYFGQSSGGFFIKFPMPFRKSFRIEVTNCDAAMPTEVFMNVLYQLTDNPDNSGYLHAQFRTGRDMEQVFEIAEVEGQGHFAGCNLSMQGTRLNDLSFLEAPEYVYVDDDWDSPRIAGTGLEDYFLGGWYFREGAFIGPVHGVSIKDALRSSIHMYRVHTNDVIRFQKRLRFTFTHPWTRENINPFFFSSVSYIYLDSSEGNNTTYDRQQLLSQYRFRDTDHQSIP